MVDYDTLKKDELQKLLRDRGMNAKGSKDDLVMRLRGADEAGPSEEESSGGGDTEEGSDQAASESNNNPAVIKEEEPDAGEGSKDKEAAETKVKEEKEKAKAKAEEENAKAKAEAEKVKEAAEAKAKAEAVAEAEADFRHKQAMVEAKANKEAKAKAEKDHQDKVKALFGNASPEYTAKNDTENKATAKGAEPETKKEVEATATAKAKEAEAEASDAQAKAKAQQEQTPPAQHNPDQPLQSTEGGTNAPPSLLNNFTLQELKDAPPPPPPPMGTADKSRIVLLEDPDQPGVKNVEGVIYCVTSFRQMLCVILPSLSERPEFKPYARGVLVPGRSYIDAKTAFLENGGRTMQASPTKVLNGKTMNDIRPVIVVTTAEEDLTYFCVRIRNPDSRETPDPSQNIEDEYFKHTYWFARSTLERFLGKADVRCIMRMGRERGGQPPIEKKEKKPTDTARHEDYREKIIRESVARASTELRDLE